MNIIQLTQAELQENLPFSLNRVEKGHTLKAVSYTHLRAHET